MQRPDGTNLELLSVEPSDRRWLAEVADTWTTTHRWWHHLGTRSPTRMAQALWENVAMQKVAWWRGAHVGLWQLTNLDLRNDVASLDFVVDSGRRDAARAAGATFVSQVFDEFPIRKLCLHVAEDGADHRGLFDEAFTKVGCYPSHLRITNSQFCDLGLYELWR
jgi:hypothetical protein